MKGEKPCAEDAIKSPKRYLWFSISAVLCVCFALLAFVVLRQKTPKVRSLEPLPSPLVPVAPVETLATTLDSVAVFHRALWRRPQPDDTILNAQRRDWSDAEGVTHWDWFLAISPGPQLQAWFATNPFSLQKVSQPRSSHLRDLAQAPAWFPKDFVNLDVFEALSGNFLLVVDPETKGIFLSDSGGGLTRPVAR